MPEPSLYASPSQAAVSINQLIIRGFCVLPSAMSGIFLSLVEFNLGIFSQNGLRSKTSLAKGLSDQTRWIGPRGIGYPTTKEMIECEIQLARGRLPGLDA